MLLIQNRSIWAAAAGALIVLVATARFRVRTRLIALLAVCVFAAALVLNTGAFGDVVGRLTESLNSSGTYYSREDSWQALINQQLSAGDPLRILFGSPMGHGYDRIESSGRLVQYAPHNWYVTVFLRTGVVGWATFVAMRIILLGRVFRQRVTTATAVFTAWMSYGSAYSWNWYWMSLMWWAANRSLALWSSVRTRSIFVDGGVPQCDPNPCAQY